MPSDKTDLRAARVAETEEKILRAATDLFVRQGYTATTLAQVAEHAHVGARTVYVRFGTKAALLKRAVDVAFAGDTAPVDVGGRPWSVLSRTAPTAAERIAALVSGARQMMERVGDILSVALQAAAVEPELAAAAHAGRLATRENLRLFWTRMASDGLLEPGRDLDWLTDTSTVLIHAETYLLARDMIGWDSVGHAEWLSTTLSRLAGLPR
ncbi:helix-turn-helix domain-containing protein [Streptomyces sp. NPDC005813]|uniref:TetR/AcrR family transcriptional regulator n=1 Tax=Streptomyces sp. NPDC005813 TaxID=3155592 RepID=UPI0034031BDD